jgi:hypothetical protein
MGLRDSSYLKALLDSNKTLGAHVPGDRRVSEPEELLDLNMQVEDRGCSGDLVAPRCFSLRAFSLCSRKVLQKRGTAPNPQNLGRVLHFLYTALNRWLITCYIADWDTCLT